VLATGETHTVREFADLAFKELDMELNWVGEGTDEKAISKRSGKVIIEVNDKYYRPTEVDMLVGDASKARSILAWFPATGFEGLVTLMVWADYDKVRKEGTKSRVQFGAFVVAATEPDDGM